jgi:crotonobetainyl-CoA:carnitine CoA-transferase CaiB-like acyl-CoA transferase
METKMERSCSRPLDGIRVLDLTVALAGPYGALMLGGLGAEVIHIEPPQGGDVARTNPPFVSRRGVNLGVKADDEVSLTIINRGRNKKSVTLDLKSEKGRELFFKMARDADVVIENMSEGVANRLGVGYEHVKRVNPKIVYGSISAFGEPSSWPGLKGMDIIVQALSGLMGVTGFSDGPPVRVGLPIADMITPLYAVNGILAALIHRGRSGEGQHIKVSMLDCMASMLAEEHFDIAEQAGQPVRTGNSHDRLVPFGVYPSKDGHVAMASFRPEWMIALVDAMGCPELLQDRRFSSRGPRMQNAKALNEIIEAWTRQHSTDDIVRELFEKRSVPVVSVRTPIEVLNDPRLHATGAVVKLSHPNLGDVQAFGMGMPIQFSKTPCQFDVPAQALGAANEQVFCELLGLSRKELDDLHASGVV